MKRIKIELCSDLCVASGDGFGSVIDTDICSDKYGIPYIPSRRIKGILRDAAIYIDSQMINPIFGISGDSKSGSLKISDAYITDYHDLKEEIIKNNLYPEQITRLFASVKASTAIDENGSVKTNSLRFTRVLENSLPWNRNCHITFYADVNIDDEFCSELSDICKSVRHIGYKRNRGYGVVRCSLEEYDKQKNTFKFDKCNDDCDYILHYAIKNEDTLMIPGSNTNVTQDYISGTSVMGLLGQEYLKNNKPDDQFKNIFMNNKIKFSNLYITDENFNEYIPVPGVFGKDKTDETKRIYNTVTEEESKKTIKPLKDGYINSSLKVKKAETEIVYHNDLSNKGHGLYTQTCISKGQLFRGSIVADGKSMNIIADLILNTDIRFGRSKTAQYSYCTLESFSVSRIKKEKVKVKNKVMYVLESDVILRDEYGTISPFPDTLFKAIGINENSTDIHKSSNIKYRNISGFNTAMRMQRPHVRAFAAGSVIVCDADNVTFDSEIYIGERQNEGFGKIRIFDAGSFMENSCRLSTEIISDVETKTDISKLVKDLRDKEKMRQNAIKYAREQFYVIQKSLSSSAIGRITMMTEESENLIDLKNRIKSITSDNVRKKANSFITNSKPKQYEKTGWEAAREYLLIILTVAKYLKKQEEK